MNIRKLCPKNYEWYIDDCPHFPSCIMCNLAKKEPEEDDIPNEAKDAINQLIKLYSNGTIKTKQVRMNE